MVTTARLAAVVQARNKPRSPLYRTYRGKEIPIYNSPTGMGLLDDCNADLPNRRIHPGDYPMSSNFDSDRFFGILVREAPDAVIYADGDGKIRFWNAGAERIFGFTEAEALERSLDIIIPENLRARHWVGFNETMRTGKTRYGAGDILAVPALRKDGTRFSIEFTLLPFHDEQGRMIGIAAILRDVTKRFDEIKALRLRLAERSAE